MRMINKKRNSFSGRTCFQLVLLCFTFSSNAQETTDSIRIPKGETAVVVELPDTMTTPGHNAYGDLLDDDPVYNKRYPLWVPAVGIVRTNVMNWAIARYVYNFDWARISTETWKQNLKGPWVWDKDRF